MKKKKISSYNLNMQNFLLSLMNLSLTKPVEQTFYAQKVGNIMKSTKKVDDSLGYAQNLVLFLL